MELEIVKISELGRIVTGKTPPTKNPEYFGDKYQFITPSDMHQGKNATSTERFLSEDGAKLLKNNFIPPGSVAVSCIGWQMGKAIKTTKPSFTNQQLNTIIPNDKVDSDFLYYLLKTKREELFSIASATGVRTPILNKSAFSEFEVSVPKKETQKKIASTLSAFDDLIENNTRRIAILGEMARLIYREWFVHFRYPGHENDRLVDSGTELGDVPEGWDLKRFGDLVDYKRESVKNEEISETVPVLGLGDMPKKSICLSEWDETNDIGSTKLRFKINDILFGKIRPYFHKVGFAQINGVCSSDIMVWRPNSNIDFTLSLLVASSEHFVETATNSSSGTKMPRAKWEVLEDYKVAYPTADILEKLNSLIGSSLNQIRTLSIQNKRLQETRDLLLPKLISGKF